MTQGRSIYKGTFNKSARRDMVGILRPVREELSPSDKGMMGRVVVSNQTGIVM